MTIQQKSYLYTLLSILLSFLLILYIFTNLNRLTGVIQTGLPEQINILNKNIYIRFLAERTVYFDEVLTQSARNFVFTASPHWKKRYQDNEKRLEGIISEAINKGNEKDIDNFNTLKAANSKLIALEYKSFELVEQQQQQEALEIMDGQLYGQLKLAYLASLNDYLESKEKEINDLLLAAEQLVQNQENNEKTAVRYLKISIITYAILLLSIIVISNTIFYRTIAKRIVSLNEGAQKIAKGHFDLSFGFASTDEFQALGNTLNSMGSNLKRITNELNQEVIKRRLAKQKETFSRELHDRLGIIISSLKLQLEKIRPEQNKREPLIIYQDCVNLLNEAYAQIREMADNPIPETISQLGLKQSLHKLFARAEMIFSIKIKFITNMEERDIEPNKKASVYTLLRELLNNSIKHARCDRITVQIINYDDHVFFMFEDNGIGFDLEKLKTKPGKGLKNAAERIKQMNGKFFIDTLPDKGTTISFEIPTSTFKN